MSAFWCGRSIEFIQRWEDSGVSLEQREEIYIKRAETDSNLGQNIFLVWICSMYSCLFDACLLTSTCSFSIVKCINSSRIDLYFFKRERESEPVTYSGHNSIRLMIYKSYFSFIFVAVDWWRINDTNSADEHLFYHPCFGATTRKHTKINGNWKWLRV